MQKNKIKYFLNSRYIYQERGSMDHRPSGEGFIECNEYGLDNIPGFDWGQLIIESIESPYAFQKNLKASLQK